MEQEKRMAGEYEVIQSMYIGDRETILGINEADTGGMPYMVAYYESNAIIGRYYDAVGSDDYAEIVEIYGRRIAEQAEKTRQELNAAKIQGIDLKPFSAADCTVITDEMDSDNQVIVIKTGVLRPEYRKSICQLKLCTGGFGAYANSRGSAVYCIDLYTGRKSRYERQDVLGVVEPEQLPKWAEHYLSVAKTAQEKGCGERGR